jgi:hypothetical protein
MINFQFDMCQAEYQEGPCEIGGPNATNATMYISTATIDMVLNILNQTILDVIVSNRQDYQVPTSDLFAAYIAPLVYNPVNFTALGEADKTPHDPPGPTAVLPESNLTNSSVIADTWSDSTFYGLNAFLKPQAYNERVYGFIAYALAVNSRKFALDGINRTWQEVELKMIASVNLVSITCFNCLIGVAILISLTMRYISREENGKACSYPDWALASIIPYQDTNEQNHNDNERWSLLHINAYSTDRSINEPATARIRLQMVGQGDGNEDRAPLLPEVPRGAHEQDVQPPGLVGEEVAHELDVLPTRLAEEEEE